MTPSGQLDLVRHLHKHDRVVALAGLPVGQVMVWLLAIGLLALSSPQFVVPIAPLLAFVMLVPSRRNEVVSLGAVYALYSVVAQRHALYSTPLDGGDLPVSLAAMAVTGGFLYLCYRAARDFRRLPLPVQRNPQVCLHLLMWGALAGAWFLLPASGFVPAALRLSIACSPFLVWRCGYLLFSGRRGRAAGSRFRDHFLYLCPIYGGDNVPHGKGHDYLSESAAKSAEDRVRSQLAGLKLLMLALMWLVTLRAMNAAVYGKSDSIFAEWLGGHSLALTALGEAMAAHAGASGSVVEGWLIVIAELIRRTLGLAVGSHIIIGCLRLFGFNVFRNTYKPLLSESIVEFWNRFLYYAKELLVEFFFFPAYVSWFRRRPKLRLLTAIFAAAFFGNSYYHVLRDLPALAGAGIWGGWNLIAPRVFYCLLLATGIYISMLRQQKLRGGRRDENPRWRWLYRLRRIAGVWLFYSVIRIWGAGPLEVDFHQRTAYFWSLLGF